MKVPMQLLDSRVRTGRDKDSDTRHTISGVSDGDCPVDAGQAAFSRLTDLSREFGPELSFAIRTVWTPSKTNGAVSNKSPNARHSRVSGGWRSGSATSASVMTSCRSSSSGVSPTAEPQSSCRLRSKRCVRCGGCVGLARIWATTTRRFWRAISRNALPPIASLRFGASCSAPAIRSRAALRLDRVREDAANGRRPKQSIHQSQCHAQRQQRAYHAIGR